jgi:tetratricopeptide (TPR) repeat protein
MTRIWLLLAIGLAITRTQTSYVDIVAQYRAGEFTQAVEALASHPEAHSSASAIQELENVDPEVSNPHLEMFPLAKRAAAVALSQVMPAAAVLHLDTGHHLLQQADLKRGVGHLMAARTIVDSKWWTIVPTILPDRLEHYDEVRHEIYRGIVFALQQQHEFETLLPHLDRARELFPKDAQIVLALGTLDELRATAIMLRKVELPKKQNPSASWRRRQRREYLDKAADRYREALAIDGRLTEARVRLGRVLLERGKLPEARRELQAAVAALATQSPASPALPAAPLASTSAGSTSPVPAPPVPVDYVASLFLGEVLEAQGDAAAAIARYQETGKRWPGCQSAHLALSRAFEATGDRRAAADALQPLWRAEAERKCVDPWWSYNDGQSWRMRALIEALRERVRDKS